MAWTYILECADGSFYVGSTTNLELRMDQHQHGKGPGYTAERRPVALVWAHEFDKIDEAWAMERRLHGWRRAKKIALINGEFELLPVLSRSRDARQPRLH